MECILKSKPPGFIRKPTNRRAFIAWLTYTLESQGVAVEQPLNYAKLQQALARHGLKPDDVR